MCSLRLLNIIYCLFVQTSSEVITIESDSDDEPPAKKNNKDVKPNVSKLNKQMGKEKDKAATSVKIEKDRKPDKEKLDRAIAKRTTGEAETTMDTSEGAVDCSRCRDKDSEIRSLTDEVKGKGDTLMKVKLRGMGQKLREMEDKLRGMEDNLENLRKHVWELMQVIVPDLELENLEMVDQVVVEMVRVNKQTPENESEAERSSETKGNESNEQGKKSSNENKVRKGAEKSKLSPETGNNVNVTACSRGESGRGITNESNDKEAAGEEETRDEMLNGEDDDQINKYGIDDAVKNNQRTTCNGEVVRNKVKTISIAQQELEIKVEDESQSQSLLSNDKKAETKSVSEIIETDTKER